jgi:hypothetical protein
VPNAALEHVAQETAADAAPELHLAVAGEDGAMAQAAPSGPMAPAPSGYSRPGADATGTASPSAAGQYSLNVLVFPLAVPAGSPQSPQLAACAYTTLLTFMGSAGTDPADEGQISYAGIENKVLPAIAGRDLLIQGSMASVRDVVQDFADAWHKLNPPQARSGAPPHDAVGSGSSERGRKDADQQGPTQGQSPSAGGGSSNQGDARQ